MATRSVEEIAQYNSSFGEFEQAINSGQERFYNCPSNVILLRELMESTKLPWPERWQASLWKWAYAEKISELASRPVEVVEKEEGDRSVVNGRRNYAVHGLPPTQKEINKKVGEFLNELTDAVSKRAQEEVDEARNKPRDTSNSFNVKMRGTPDPSLPETDPKVQEFLGQMQKDNSAESKQLLKNYMKARSTYRNTHITGDGQ